MGRMVIRALVLFDSLVWNKFHCNELLAVQHTTIVPVVGGENLMVNLKSGEATSTRSVSESCLPPDSCPHNNLPRGALCT